MVASILVWFVGLVVYSLVILRLFRRQQLCTLALTTYLAIQINIRPVLFFLGLDTPLVDGAWRDFWPQTTIASLAGLFWILVFYGFYSTFSSSRTARGRGWLPQGPAQANALIIAIIAVLSTTIAVASTMQLVLQEGSIARFMVNVKIGKEYTGSYWIREISVTAAIICFYGLLSAAKETPLPGRFRIIPAGSWWFYGLLILANLMMNYFWGNRINIAMFGFAAILALNFYVRPFRIHELVLVLLIAVASLQGLRVLRGTFMEDAKGLSDTVLTETDVRSLSNSFHLSEFDALSLAIRDCGRLFDFRLGADFWNGLLSWIPRSFLPEKETFHIGGWFRRVYEPERTNGWPVTVIGDWYINFWYAGVFLGAAISAFLSSMFDRAYRGISNNAWQVIMAPMMGFFFFQGGVGTGTPQAVFTVLLPLALVAAALRITQHR